MIRPKPNSEAILQVENPRLCKSGQGADPYLDVLRSAERVRKISDAKGWQLHPSLSPGDAMLSELVEAEDFGLSTELPCAAFGHMI